MKHKNRNGIGRISAVLCMLCMMLVAFPVTLTVNAESAAKLTTSAVTTEREEVAAVTFMLEGNPGIWGLKIKVDYDHSALTLQSVTNGSIFEENDVTVPNSLAREQYVFVAASNKLEDITANGSLVTLNFLVEKDAAAGTYPITAEVTQAINCASEDVDIDVVNGSITVNVVDEPTASPVPDEAKPVTSPATAVTEQEEAGTALVTSSAKTGDNNNLILWIVLAVFAVAGGGVCYVLHIRRKRKSHR